jgi:SAM-dependent methyltransferase
MVRAVISSLARRLRLIWLAFRARRAASTRNCPAMEFDGTGRLLGLRLLLRGDRSGVEWLLQPIESVRYPEFGFARDCLPKHFVEALDVSSPRLFSLHLAKRRSGHITMLNPDRTDIEETKRLIKIARLGQISLREAGVELLREAQMQAKFDVIWSISVVEHIAGDYSDSDAMRFMYDALKPGGRLIITVPVDREFRSESIAEKLYGTQPMQSDGTFFFQHYYDAEAIKTRLSYAIGTNPAVIRWFGESRPGWWNNYRAEWSARGMRRVADVIEMVENFCEFGTWEDMPGSGICGLMYMKH